MRRSISRVWAVALLGGALGCGGGDLASHPAALVGTWGLTLNSDFQLVQTLTFAAGGAAGGGASGGSACTGTMSLSGESWSADTTEIVVDTDGSSCTGSVACSQNGNSQTVGCGTPGGTWRAPYSLSSDGNTLTLTLGSGSQSAQVVYVRQ